MNKKKRRKRKNTSIKKNSVRPTLFGPGGDVAREEYGEYYKNLTNLRLRRTFNF